MKAIEKMQVQVKPTHIAVIWDGGLDEERTEALEEYKAERDPMPTTWGCRRDRRMARSRRPVQLVRRRREADDVIGTLAWQAEAANLPVVIASSDKDFFNSSIPTFDCSIRMTKRKPFGRLSRFAARPAWNRSRSSMAEPSG